MLTVNDIHKKVKERLGERAGCERTTRRLIERLGIRPAQVVVMGKAKVSLFEDGVVEVLVKELGEGGGA